LIFSEKDIKQIEQKGLSLKKVKNQIELFETGIPFINLVAEATINEGILRLSEKEIQESMSFYESKKDIISILKFVPASGAATRMFKFLYSFLEEYDLEKESINSYINRHKNNDLSLFFYRP